MNALNIRGRWQRVRTVPGLGKDVSITGLLVLVAVAAVIWIQTNLATGAPWSERQTVKVEFASVPGTNPAAASPVTMAGVPVGRVVAAEPTDHDTAVLTLELAEPQPVYANARAVLRPKNPLNEMSVELNPGGPPAAPLGPGQVLPVSQTERPVQADEVLRNLDDRAQRALTDLLVESDAALVRAPTELPDALHATTDTAVALRPVVQALQTRRERISQLVSALSRVAGAVGDDTGRTVRLADSTQRALNTLASSDEAVRASLAQLPGLSDQLRSAMSATQDLTGQLDPTLDNLNRASHELPPALDKLRTTTGKAGEVVDAAAPVLDKARPVVSDLRPLVGGANRALDDLRPITRALPKDTSIILSYLVDLRGFVYNTSSVFGAGGATGGIIRGHAVAAPGGGVIPEHTGYAPGPENGLDPSTRAGGVGPMGGNR